MGAAFAFIGFGEAGAAFAGGARARGYDRKTDSEDTRAAKLADFAAAGVEACLSGADALAGVPAVLSLVTPDQALVAAVDAASSLRPGALWFDMNSAAPDTKRAAAAVIEAAGGRYVDVAVMSPVHPARLATPLLVSGPHAGAGAAWLATIGFSHVALVPGPAGAASSIKMIRSVMVKGLEALTAECFLAAEAAGVSDAVRASLDASWPGTDWGEKADYNLGRMMAHGVRRAAEMEEVVRTLDALGTGSEMARATAERQRAIGALALAVPPTLAAKVEAIRGAV
jgi:3-hydroxyisobutyrate dehydrogenase-like beta-hydroxyacid dehydrogenase